MSNATAISPLMMYSTFIAFSLLFPSFCLRFVALPGLSVLPFKDQSGVRHNQDESNDPERRYFRIHTDHYTFSQKRTYQKATTKKSRTSAM